MKTQRVKIEIKNQIAHVILNRADKHNALDMPMFYGITDVLDKVKQDRNIRVVIVSGEGESFSSGLDIKLYHKIWCNKQEKILANETFNQWKILLGKNQKIAVKRAQGDNNINYV